MDSEEDVLQLEVPNIFVREYLLDNYKKDLAIFFPLGEKIEFVVKEPKKIAHVAAKPLPKAKKNRTDLKDHYTLKILSKDPLINLLNLLL